MRLSSKSTCINPQTQVYMAGYIQRQRKNNGILDDLMLVATLLEINHEKLLIINMDLSGTDEELTEVIKSTISKIKPISPDNIVLTSGHTHSGPVINNRWNFPEFDLSYRIYLTQKILDTALSCFDDLVEVEATYKTTQIEGFYSNRNSLDDYSEKRVHVIEFRDKDQKLVSALINMACHSTILNHENEALSGDLFGNLRHRYHKKYGVYPLMMQGASGDMSNRLYRLSNDKVELDRTVSGIFAQIEKMNDGVKLNLDSLKVSKLEYPVVYEPDIADLTKRIAEMNEEKKHPVSNDRLRLIDSGLVGLERKLHQGKTEFLIKIFVYTLGEVQFVIIPGELSACLGKKIIDQSSNPRCMVFGYANEMVGYLISIDQFKTGSHEANATKTPVGVIEKVIDQLATYL